MNMNNFIKANNHNIHTHPAHITLKWMNNTLNNVWAEIKVLALKRNI